MATFTHDSWQMLGPLLDCALDMSLAERRQWLNELSERSPTLADEVKALLDEEALADRNGFLAVEQHVSLAGFELGAYRLERPLGQGGMGTVWLARRADGRFEGTAAVKLLNLALVSTTGQERFRREGSMMARLAHPGIARLLDAGVSTTGQPYLILEYVDGQPIDAFARERELGLTARIDLFRQVIAAVGHAHTNLIVHRDLKPSNIMVTAKGTVKLLDFGIAKLLGDESLGETSLITLEGRVFTPSYAAPEQVRGETLTTATDVYALGVLLYVLLSGRHPTSENAQTPVECVRSVLEVEPARLKLGDLDSILAKCLRKVAAERYQSVAAFGDDLERYLHQEPVNARAPSHWYRTQKFVRRNWLEVMVGLAVVATLFAATMFSLAKRREAQRERDLAVRERERGDAQVEFQNVLLSTVGNEGITMRQILDAGRGVLEKQYAEDERMLTPLLLQLAQSYSQLGDSTTQGVLLDRAESLARTGNDTELLAEVRCNVADNLREKGRYEEAWRVLGVAESLRRVRPDLMAKCLGVHAVLATETRHGEEGIRAAQQAIAIMEGLGKTRTLLYFDLLNILAGALHGLDHPREAVATFRRAIMAMDASGHGGTLSSSIMRHNLARTLGMLGETAEAERIFREALDQAERASPKSRINWQAGIHYAEAALMQNHAESALKYFALITSQGVSDANLYWEGRGLFGVARAQIQLGRLAEARLAKARLEQIIATYPHVRDTDDQVPDGRSIDGLLEMAVGDMASAHQSFMDTLRSNGYFEGKLKKRLRPVVLLTAETDLSLGNLQEALTLAHEGVRIAAIDSLTEMQSAHVGDARVIEARALVASGDTAGARAAIEKALPALQKGAGIEHPRTREAENLLTELRR